MKQILAVSAVFIQLCGLVLFAQAPVPPPSRPEVQRAASFVKALAQALSRRDRDAVAEMVRYPASATVGGIGIPIASRVELIRLYDGIFTAELRCLVDDTVANGAAAIRVDAGGATIGKGRIHAQEVGGTWKITNIDVPPATEVGAPPPSPPRPVNRTLGTVQFAGRLYGNGVDTYVLSARRGAIVHARIEQFPGRSAFLRVVEAKTGTALGRTGASAPRVWDGTIREPGDYRIEVVRLAPYCMPSFTYLLTITIK